eukprot:CAMPEP_0202892812 /NCGR_PEP_ID=MMETSP1392-20130828/2505_1 /ASSEMBLY_ACC=CAM_ASM_000868 /TAXON_ID=225041 /ORGANISM="Chlamydomonas chlamydogama, Strain SAG 11-48b" /LENGTH=364 /DNA_ID=CAMNT_0049576907 /DNA_START=658 /DNA_END=1752 /DNA_ORIENTATION=+
MAGTLYPPAYDCEKNAPKCTVAVTGATGFVAGRLVERLLALGHTVHGTCRDPKKAEHLQKLPGASERLKLFSADLLTEGAFDEAFKGCDYVMHTASPFVTDLKPNEVQDKLIKPAIQGTQNVLGSVNRTPSIKRVALTSSGAAVYGNPNERGPGHVFTEEDWSLTPTEKVLPYYYSKREAEKAAWDIAGKQDRWQLVTINPTLVMGPPLGARDDGECVTLVKRILKGEFYPAAPYTGAGMVDIRDVAAAHCLAAFHPAAKGRYIVSGTTILISDVCRMISELYPGWVRPPCLTAPKFLIWLLGPSMGLTRDMVTHSIGMPGPQFSRSKVEGELGFKFTELRTTMKDMIERMVELGMVQKPAKVK